MTVCVWIKLAVKDQYVVTRKTDLENHMQTSEGMRSSEAMVK